MSQNDELFSQNMDDLGKTIRARVADGFKEGANLANPKLFHLRKLLRESPGDHLQRHRTENSSGG